MLLESDRNEDRMRDAEPSCADVICDVSILDICAASSFGGVFFCPEISEVNADVMAELYLAPDTGGVPCFTGVCC